MYYVKDIRYEMQYIYIYIYIQLPVGQSPEGSTITLCLTQHLVFGALI